MENPISMMEIKNVMGLLLIVCQQITVTEQENGQYHQIVSLCEQYYWCDINVLMNF